ncbi:SsgA family sporulation/cell division regulator [Streptomyces sp. XM4193]|uniref:SsgA family sporulation/cell division regulator n=1 Tax=Streptomyces sp. XM4193 TaxID=2929782 RepID=UPI001FFC1821|nr:SsgA family sporulation/cell division regulator [Streptomyces sp. XM4193]MCK1796820.1 SsgA family sporulation/cell division regulator [Streptomyces sp. XM4193]
MTAHIEERLEARIVAAAHTPSEVTVTLRYERTDPYAVSVLFPPRSTMEGSEVVWIFSRDLLESGLRAPEGEGDVRLWPSGRDCTVVELRTPDATAMVEFDTTALRRFLWHSYRLTPRGDEHLELDVDGALFELFDEAQ